MSSITIIYKRLKNSKIKTKILRPRSIIFFEKVYNSIFISAFFLQTFRKKHIYNFAIILKYKNDIELLYIDNWKKYRFLYYLILK